MTYKVAPSRVQLPMWPIYICVAVTALGIGIINPIIPKLLEKNGADEFIVGLSTSLMFASLVLTGLPIGKHMDRIGIRPFLILGLLIYCLPMALMPFTNKIIYFFLLRIFEGIGWSCVWTAAETYVTQVSSPEQRGHNTAVYAMSLASGTAAGPMVGAVMMHFFNIIAPFMLAVILAIGAMILVILILPEPHVHREEHLGSGISFRITRPLILPLAIAFLYGYGTLSLVALLPTLNYTSFQLGLLITVTVVGNIVAQIPIGRMLDRFGYRPLLLGSLSLLCGAAVLAAFQPPFNVVLLLGALLGAFAGTLYPIGLAILGARVPSAKLGGANGMFTVCYGLGSVVGPGLTGWIMSLVGKRHSDQALFGTIGVLVFCLLMMLVFKLDHYDTSQEHAIHSSSGGFKPPV